MEIEVILSWLSEGEEVNQVFLYPLEKAFIDVSIENLIKMGQTFTVTVNS